jgi:Flp pilus assembly protein TadG
MYTAPYRKKAKGQNVSSTVARRAVRSGTTRSAQRWKSATAASPSTSVRKMPATSAGSPVTACTPRISSG